MLSIKSSISFSDSWSPAPTGGVHPLYVVNCDYLPLFNRRGAGAGVCETCAVRDAYQSIIFSPVTWAAIALTNSS
jgi:hypothetical protein